MTRNGSPPGDPQFQRPPPGPAPQHDLPGMAKTAAELLDELARQELVAPHILNSLRQQVGHTAKPISAATIARLLVEKKHLTAVQAERLLGASLSAAAPVSAKTAPSAPSLTETKPMLLDELGLAPLDEPSPATGTPTSETPAPRLDEPLDLELLDLLPLDDAPAPTAAKSPVAKSSGPAKQSPASVKRTATPTKKAPAAAPHLPPGANAPAGLTPLEPLPLDTLQPLDVLSPLDGLSPLDQPPAPLPMPASRPAKPALNPLAPAARVPLPAAAPPIAAAAPALGLAPPARPAQPTGRSSRGMLWLAGTAAGLILLLSIGGAAAWLFLPRGNGDQEFKLAEQDYQAQQYAAAAEKYSKLLQAFPRHPQASLARVRRGMARIAAAKGTGENWQAVLPVAREVLSEIDREVELPRVQGQLAPLLTEMADRLVKRAQGAEPDTANLQQAREALALAGNGRYIPGELRDWQRLAAVEESLALAERKNSAQQALSQAASAAKTALGKSDLTQAYAEWDKLLATFPELAGDAGFSSLESEFTKVAAASVQPLSKLGKAQTTEHSTPVLASVTLSAAPIATASGPMGVFLARAGGSVWGLDAATGKVLWRRPVGSGPGIAPVPLAADEDSDVLLVDAEHDELICVKRRTGALAWRFPLESRPAGSPIVIGKKICVTSRSGRVSLLDAQSGNVVAAAQLPTSAAMGAVASPDGRRLYQLADRHLLYILAADNLKCMSAFFLGHQSGSVCIPPQLVAGRVLMAENASVAQSILHAISLDESGLPQAKAQELKLPGLVFTPPIAYPQHLLVLTDRAMALLELPASAGEPFKSPAETNAQGNTSLLRFGVATGNRCIAADVGLRRYDLAPAGSGPALAWENFGQDLFDSPPQAIGDVILCVRRAPGRRGWIAAAVKSANGAPLWETPLGVPLASMSLEKGTSPRAVTALGSVGTINLESVKGATVQEVATVAAAGKQLAIAASVPLADGGQLLVPEGQPRELWLLDAAGKPRSIPLPDAASGTPVAGAGGVLVPCSSGTVYWLNDDGTPAEARFQMRMAAGDQLDRCSAAAVGDDGRQFVVSDGRRSLYLLTIEAGPAPRLRLLASAELDAPPVARIAALGDHVYLVDGAGNLKSFALPDLKRAKSQPLSAAAVVSGPHRVGQTLILATDRQELICIDGNRNIRWKVPLQDGRLAGSPVESPGGLLVAMLGGVLLQIDADSGKELARSDVGEPLAGVPLVFGGEALVSTADGSLLRVQLPDKEADKP